MLLPCLYFAESGGRRIGDGLHSNDWNVGRGGKPPPFFFFVTKGEVAEAVLGADREGVEAGPPLPGTGWVGAFVFGQVQVCMHHTRACACGCESALTLLAILFG